MRFGGLFDGDHALEQLEELSRELSDPAVWNSPERAQDLGRQQAKYLEVVNLLKTVSQKLQDASDWLSLAQEESAQEKSDTEALLTVESELNDIAKILEAQSFKRMFNHPFDSGNCYLDVQAGSGGTEAQDWADMLLRMYLRWSEHRGFKTTVMPNFFALKAE